jgi:hypothetical protein
MGEWRGGGLEQVFHNREVNTGVGVVVRELVWTSVFSKGIGAVRRASGICVLCDWFR